MENAKPAPTGATLDDLNGLIIAADCNDRRIPLGATIWDGARLYTVVGFSYAKMTHMVRVRALDTGEETVKGPQVHLVLHGALQK